ncbi:MAG: putative lipid II flippase FtsW [Microbacteriaceae bacterium]
MSSTGVRRPAAPPGPARRPAGGTRRPASGASASGAPASSASVPVPQRFDARVAVRRVFASEGVDYFLLLGVTLFLVVFGLVMVLSSSSVESYLDNDENSFASFLRQGLYALIGVPLMFVASAMSPRFWATWAGRAVVIGFGLQLLVFTPLGFGYGGNRNWIAIGGFTAQPSELVKLALVLWLAWILARKQELLEDWKHVALPIVPVAGIAILLVLAGSDLGTAIIMLTIVFGALFFAAVRLRYLIVPGLFVAGAGVLLAFTSDSRSARISAWLAGCGADDTTQPCWQPLHGIWALASGGVLGVGLGNSKMKWSWLPEADNDYIFAIIGEELGLVGAIVVLALFVVLAVSFLRIMRSTSDLFGRLVVGGVMVWVVGQALVNIAVVLGMLPVLGVPLPLISAGGSALITTLLAIGVVLSFARDARREELR